MARVSSPNQAFTLPKAPAGINGFDEVTGGGLPKGRTTLVVGSPGCGKTLFGMQFLAYGATHGEPGVCLQFDESEAGLAANVASLGVDLRKLERQKKLLVDHIRVERNEIEETGEYNLDGLFIRLGHAVRTIGAKRVMIDGVEVLFAGLTDEGNLRMELRRLFRWLDDQGLTAIVTGERGDRTLTRRGLEEYIADCVILMDHRVTDQISTRRLRIVKYRGTPHGTDEYPFLIDNDGITLIPVTSLALNHRASTERVSTGFSGLDQMMEGRGFFRGSSILVSGGPGSGKSSLAARFVESACGRGESCVYFAFEESPSQIVRNMASVGIRLERYSRKGLLQFHAVRPTSAGLEGHLAAMQKLVSQLQPAALVVDPMTSILSEGNHHATKLMLTRLIDFLKMRQVTSLFTDLMLGQGTQYPHEGVSSLMDTWILLRSDERNGDGPSRTLTIVKSRGMAHSRGVRELLVKNGKIGLAAV